MKWLIAIALVAGCAKKAEDKPAPGPNNEPAIPADELKRGEDACAGYIAKVCKCAETVPAAKDKCTAAQSFPEVIKIQTQTTMSKDSSAMDVKQAARDIRKTIAECIELTAQLPSLGCTL
jgi:hypothetical protein